jgi:hypothetical protein
LNLSPKTLAIGVKLHFKKIEKVVEVVSVLDEQRVS